VIAAASTAFALTAAAAETEFGHSTDRAVVRWVSGGPDAFESVAAALLVLGTLTGLLTLVPAAWLRFGRWTVAAQVAVAALCARLLAVGAKEVFATDRPTPADRIDVREITADPAFPSAHAAVAFAIAAVWSWRGNRCDRIIAFTLAAVVGSLRWYVGAHFVVDVAGGAALGLVVGTAVTWIANHFERPATSGDRPL
jgi:undecaprenyl-diphosphatase